MPVRCRLILLSSVCGFSPHRITSSGIKREKPHNFRYARSVRPDVSGNSIYQLKVGRKQPPFKADGSIEKPFVPSYEIGGDATVTITGIVVVAIAIVVDIAKVSGIRRIRRIRLFPFMFFLAFHFEPPFIFPAKILYLISLFCFLQPFKSAISLSIDSAYGSNFDKDNGKMSAQNTSS